MGPQPPSSHEQHKIKLSWKELQEASSKGTTTLSNSSRKRQHSSCHQKKGGAAGGGNSIDQGEGGLVATSGSDRRSSAISLTTTQDSSRSLDSSEDKNKRDDCCRGVDGGCRQVAVALLDTQETDGVVPINDSEPTSYLSPQEEKHALTTKTSTSSSSEISSAISSTSRRSSQQSKQKIMATLRDRARARKAAAAEAAAAIASASSIIQVLEAPTPKEEGGEECTAAKVPSLTTSIGSHCGHPPTPQDPSMTTSEVAMTSPPSANNAKGAMGTTIMGQSSSSRISTENDDESEEEEEPQDRTTGEGEGDSTSSFPGPHKIQMSSNDYFRQCAIGDLTSPKLRAKFRMKQQKQQQVTRSTRTEEASAAAVGRGQGRVVGEELSTTRSSDRHRRHSLGQERRHHQDDNYCDDGANGASKSVPSPSPLSEMLRGHRSHLDRRQQGEQEELMAAKKAREMTKLSSSPLNVDLNDVCIPSKGANASTKISGQDKNQTTRGSSIYSTAKDNKVGASPVGGLSSAEASKTAAATDRAVDGERRRRSLSDRSSTENRRLSGCTSDKNSDGTNRKVLKPLPLSVQREKDRRQSLAADLTSPTSSSSAAFKSPTNDDTRKNLDKRTARLRYAEAFKTSIAASNASSTSMSSFGGGGCREMVDLYQRSRRMGSAVTTVVRKRPIFGYELDRGDYDVVSTSTTPPPDGGDGRSANSSEVGGDAVLVHNCTMHPDMRQKLLRSNRYPCTAAFGEACTNDEVYIAVADPLVRSAALHGGISTILMYGQTGSGKTFTMTSIEERACSGLFNVLRDDERKRGEGGGDDDEVVTITVRFIELAGKVCRDLLIPSRSRRKSNATSTATNIKIVDGGGEDGSSVQVLGVTERTATTPEELMKIIALGKSRRATEATDANGVSSRSHAVCQIEITRHSSVLKDFAAATNTRLRTRGMLTLIDCAGSERKNDSLYHSVERQKESAEINASIYALKECVRARTLKLQQQQAAMAEAESARVEGRVECDGMKSPQPPPIHVPYRGSNLTRILRESFERDNAQFTVIATVAPNATDTEHTMETLKTVASIAGLEEGIIEGRAQAVADTTKAENVVVPPKLWDHKRLAVFLRKKGVPPDAYAGDSKLTGKAVMRMNRRQIASKFFAGDASRGDALFHALRKETDRVDKIHRREREDRKVAMRGAMS